MVGSFSSRPISVRGVDVDVYCLPGAVLRYSISVYIYVQSIYLYVCACSLSIYLSACSLSICMYVVFRAQCYGTQLHRSPASRRVHRKRHTRHTLVHLPSADKHGALSQTR